MTELLGGLAAHLEDPDFAVTDVYRRGVRLGYRRRMARTPAVYARKVRWASHVGEDAAALEWASN